MDKISITDLKRALELWLEIDEIYNLKQECPKMEEAVKETRRVLEK